MLLGNLRCIARAIIFSAILIAGIIRISEASSLLGTEANGLFTIDDNTAEAGLVGNVQFGGGTLILSALAFGTDGTLFGTAGNGLFTIDPTTGIASLVGNVQFDGGTLILSTLAIWPFVIDIKPNDDRNRINLCAKGPLSVAILSSEAFDAPTEVDPATVQLAGAGVKTVGKDDRPLTQARDVNGEGLTDLIVKFDPENLGLDSGDTEAELTARTFGGTPIKAKDAVEVEERMCLRTLE